MMQNQELYRKYRDGRHWEQHPTIYANSFALFLRSKNFSGIVMDAGCGDGRDVCALQWNGLVAHGFDYSDDEITLAKHKHPSSIFSVRNVENLDLSDESVGAFYMINVIHYVDAKKAFSEIKRVLKTGGYFFIHFNLEIKKDNGEVDFHSDEQELEKLFTGFEVIQRYIIERTDKIPFIHHHKILEVILRKI